MELTSVNGRDAPVDPIVEAANAAFTRIESHRKLFRRDWLPFCDGVCFLSREAWKRAGQPTRLDGRPDWTEDRVQIEFRGLTAVLPWAGFFAGRRRTLLATLRQIGGDREDFLTWYDALSDEVRERTGYPDTLWRMFKARRNEKKPDTDTDDDPNDEQGRTTEQATDEARIRTDDDRMAELVGDNERWNDFGLRLRTSLRSGQSTLTAGLREELDRLLERA